MIALLVVVLLVSSETRAGPSIEFVPTLTYRDAILGGDMMVGVKVVSATPGTFSIECLGFVGDIPAARGSGHVYVPPGSTEGYNEIRMPVQGQAPTSFKCLVKE